MPINSYRANFSLMDFGVKGRILDVGCGNGFHLTTLVANGYQVSGVEPTAALVECLTKEGFDVKVGFAERLPYPDGSFEGILCSVVIPYTDENIAIAEWGRVLVPAGEVLASYHGFGYGLRLLFGKRKLKTRLYGARMISNTLVYRLTGKRLKGWMGDTLCQSEARLMKYYDQLGFQLLRTATGKEFMGQPVFIYHHLKKWSEVAVPNKSTPLSP